MISFDLKPKCLWCIAKVSALQFHYFGREIYYEKLTGSVHVASKKCLILYIIVSGTVYGQCMRNPRLVEKEYMFSMLIYSWVSNQTCSLKPMQTKEKHKLPGKNREDTKSLLDTVQIHEHTEHSNITREVRSNKHTPITNSQHKLSSGPWFCLN